MKRAVRFSFMDLSTLAKREAATRAELELNRRTAPQLYEAVLPVTRAADGALALDGPGPPVEWLLRMRRFPAGDQLDEVAGRGELTPAIVDRLAEVIADFHAAAEVTPDRGGESAMRAVVDGNAGDLRSLVPAVFDEAEVAGLDEATTAELARVAGLLEERRAAGQGAPLPWRSALAQHRPSGRPAGPLRLPRVQRGAGLDRRALRPGLPGHGSPRPRAPGRGMPAAPGLWRPCAGRSWAGTAAALPRGPGGRPGQGRRVLRATASRPGPIWRLRARPWHRRARA